MQITSAKMLANAVRDQRKAQNITQSDTAKLVGIKQTTVSAFENTPEGTKLDTLFKLLAALDLELHVQPRNSTAETQSSNQQWNEEW
ncbi:transcriptional regulator [Photobacterium kishitanii]|uniref:Transcriptional regulator n=1 Tax=Photobacterium kishitanii TaxID=318456 RepID=A0A2T3R0I2_9GAMM|nr:helix-turn-helix domain-containing protein [Photobacterium kishitanii]KJG10738.1 XRE family transcriptional regulator [Photobacterium kishitanii]KJG59746.1 XRE family transcriptional regulator [Photobacterium kishitanii]KJG63035.1 XRE family transcriptional regulator [Photobacterium kishitanii]KJG67953.1 XRE family transcriptional regulator [Photobacterium kishitanii]KJG71209.1 XRE family transcriptional regulator [Photobacterium kishitanii]